MAAASARGLLFALGQRVERRNPWACRADPLLPPRRQLIALAQNADPHGVRRLHALADSRRVEWRAAFAAERLHAWNAAVGGVLHIDGRLPFHLERGPRIRKRHAEGGAGAGLTIGAVAHLCLFRIGLALD